MMPEEESVDETQSGEEGSQQAQTRKGKPKKVSPPESVEVPAFTFRVTDLIGKMVEMRLSTTRDGDSTICGMLAGMDDFFVYIKEADEVTAYNSAHMISIRSRRPMPVSKGREDFVKPGEDDVVNKSQADIERQKDANKKRRDEMLEAQRKKVSGQTFK